MNVLSHVFHSDFFVGTKFKRTAAFNKIDVISFIPCMQTPLAVVCAFLLLFAYHPPNFVLPLSAIGPST